MTDEEWEAIAPEEIEIGKCVWPDHHVDWRRIRRMARDDVGTYDPIHVEQLVTGHYFVHDGRHRMLRVRLDGRLTVRARVVRHGTATHH